MSDPRTLGQQALAHHQAGRLTEALAGYEALLALAPNHAGAWNNRGSLLMGMARLTEALDSFTRASALLAPNADIQLNRGNVLARLTRWTEARTAFDTALALNPALPGALRSRAELAWTHFRDYDAARRDLEQLVAVAPDFDYAQGDLLHMKMHGGDWDGFEAALAAITDGVRAGRKVVRPFVYQGLSDSPADLLACARIFTRDMQAATHNFAPRRHDRIRIGYMTTGFSEHAVSLLIVGLLEKHDAARFEIFGLDIGETDASPTRKRIEAAAHMIPLAHLSDAEALATIRALEIDILVDVNGFFGANRMDVLAARAAPIQVSYMGTPSTTGASFYDYAIADRIVIPPGEERFFAENIVRLPGTYWVNDNQRPIADTIPGRADCGLPEDAFVFCNFNQSYKLLPASFDAWMNILQRVPGSVLWLWQNNSAFPGNLRRAAQARGIDPQRLVFAPTAPPPDHLARLKLADLSLDGLPYNAHTTAADVLWTGTPILTCRGTTFPARVAASLLQAIGLPELVTDNWRDFEDTAVALATDKTKLAAIRAKLAANRDTTPLFDTDLWRRHIETAYTAMWARHESGQPAQGFDL